MENLKRWARILDALLSLQTGKVRFRGQIIRNTRPFFWPESSQAWFGQEIEPYFQEKVWDKKYGTIIDAGSAQGLFLIAAKKIQKDAHFFAFEPSLRQRILMHKNLILNRAQNNIQTFPYALWNEGRTLAFRTHGALSSLAKTQQLPEKFFFQEKTRGIRIDEWPSLQEVRHPVLLKMDIEGAEIEALEGAKGWLAFHRPTLLIQAYHIRDGTRTLERARGFLHELGLRAWESETTPGLLVSADRNNR